MRLCPTCLAQEEDHSIAGQCPMEVAAERRARQAAERSHPRPTTFWNKYGG